MDGIRLIRLLDVLPVQAMENAVGISPRSIVVRGENFRAVETVLINGAESPSFVVYSPTQLIAQVPEEYEDAVLTDVTVLSSAATYTSRSVLELTVGTRIRKVSGPQRLLQNFIRHLLRSPGSNTFHRNSGGGLGQRVGNNITDRLAADIAVSINNTKQYIIAVQTPERNIAPSERLLSAEIAGLTADTANAAVYVTIILTSHSGNRAAATLVT